MTRKKVKLAFITNDSARKATYKKRKRGLLKKMEELTTLCDVKACAVLYSPYESKPVVWPGTSGARDVISSFKRLPEMEKVKKMVSQEEFLRQRVVKAHEQLKRQQKENREKEMTQVMYECLMGKGIQNMSLLDLSDLSWVTNQHLNEISKRVEGLRKETQFSPNNNTSTNNNDNSSTTTTNNHVNCVSGEGLLQGQNGEFDDVMNMQMMMQQPWSSFMDMMGATMVNDHHHHHNHNHNYNHNHNPHQQHMEMGGDLGLGSGISSGSSGETIGVSNNCGNNNNNNMNMMMMMGGHQFGDDYQIHNGHGHGHGPHGVNLSMWSNPFFP